MKGSSGMGTLKIDFVVRMDSSTRASWALDDVRLIEGSCPEAGACDFEDDKCTWADGEGDIVWLRKSGDSRPNNEKGPPTDKTSETSTGYYVFINIENKSPNLKAQLVSEPFPPSKKPTCIKFWYYMKGKEDLGTLKVRRSLENITEISLWILSGHQQSKRLQGATTARESDLASQIIFEGTTGTGNSGLMALDDILIKTGEPCAIMPDNADPRYEGYYLQAVEKDGASMGETTNLVSPQFKKNLGIHCLTFWYYRPGYGIGKIGVYTRVKKEEKFSGWSVAGDVGKLWHFAQVNISQSSDFNILIQAEKGPGNARGDQMVIDDIWLKNAVCSSPGDCNFNNDYCSYFLNSTSDFSWLLGTGRVVNPQFVEKPPQDSSIANEICTFDTDDNICGYVQDIQNTASWDVRSGEDDDVLFKMPDHTTQSIAGRYLYTAFNTSISATESKRARIFSPKVAPSNDPKCVSFFYHVNNATSLGFNAYISTDNGRSDPLWTTTISQSLLWHGARFTAVSKSLQWQVMFEAEVAKGGSGQVALDDISIEAGECPRPGSCDFEKENSMWENVRAPYNTTMLPKGTSNLFTNDIDCIRHIGEDYFGPSVDNTRGRNQVDFSVQLRRNNRSVDIWIPEDKSPYVWTSGESIISRIP